MSNKTHLGMAVAVAAVLYLIGYFVIDVLHFELSPGQERVIHIARMAAGSLCAVVPVIACAVWEQLRGR